ncbi:hypothetical protein [Novosphingobium sp. fls2-241-R2A-195]|uniref:hypothetical protein n=1 Tax=Novosphingobium sp. fls2-241-R2A-195 TaxID=3040296 RepID=UPI00254AF44C|nr:hypothetical protein [Novosphingobium sp. fls2-241-R2A-195]
MKVFAPRLRGSGKACLSIPTLSQVPVALLCAGLACAPTAHAQTTGQAPPPAIDEVPAAPLPETETQDESKPSGLKLGGAIRGRYDLRFNSAGADGGRRTSSNLSFDTLILKADYDSETFFGAAQYRFYGGSFLYGKDYGYHNYPGEISFPVYAYAGAKLGKHDKVAVGVQPVPFDDQFWGSAFLNSMGFVIGLEEVYNAGITYAHEEDAFNVTAGFFPTTAPNAFGISDDAARYSVNIVKGDRSNPLASRNAERNMIVGRAEYKLASSDTGSLSVMGSGWYSTIHNFDTNEDGWRRAFAVSLKGTQGPWHAKLLAARQDMSLRNPGNDRTVTVGNYDAPFNIAADGTLLFGEVGRKIDTGSLPFSVQLFANYAYFAKADSGFRDTQRLNLGAFWTDKATGRIRIWSEFLLGRSDPFVGAGQYTLGAAEGGDGRTKASFLTICGYYF